MNNCLSCLKTKKVKYPFEGCILITSLTYLLNQQINLCTNEFMKMNDAAMKLADHNSSKREIHEYYDSMMNILEYMVPLKEYIINSTSNKEFYLNLFDNKPNSVNKDLFQNYHNLFYKDVNH